MIAIVAADFNSAIVDAMIAAATAEAKKMRAKVADTVRVSGSYELPLHAARLLAKKKIDALVVLGFIEKGETSHGEVMGHVVSAALLDLSLRHDKPIGMGIIGPNATLAQATARKSSYARAAVRAALRSLKA